MVRAPTPETVNLRNIFFTGLPSIINWEDVPKLTVGWSDLTYVSAAGVNVRAEGDSLCVGVEVGVKDGSGVGELSENHRETMEESPG